MFVFEVAVQVEKGKAALRNYTALSALTIPAIAILFHGTFTIEIARSIKSSFCSKKR